MTKKVSFLKSDFWNDLNVIVLFWWSRQPSGMQVSGRGLNVGLTKDDCILNQIGTGWWGGGIRGYLVNQTRS